MPGAVQLALAGRSVQRRRPCTSPEQLCPGGRAADAAEKRRHFAVQQAHVLRLAGVVVGEEHVQAAVPQRLGRRRPGV
eukprot:3844123-Pyramimonas_sp.AAC.1